MEETYGFPYFLIHRGDLHKVLLMKAQEVGVDILTSSFVSSVDEDACSITLGNGSVHMADVIVGADGKDLTKASELLCLRVLIFLCYR